MYIKKTYTEEMILDAVKKCDDVTTLREIKEKLGCSKGTAFNLLKSMLASGKIKRVNKGTETKQIWIYSRVNKDV